MARTRFDALADRKPFKPLHRLDAYDWFFYQFSYLPDMRRFP